MSAKDYAMKNPALVAGVVLGGLALLWVAKKGAGNVGSTLAGGVIDLASGLLTGAAVGLGSVVGLPQTDQAKGAAAVAAGDALGASLYLPAGQYITAQVGNTPINPLAPLGSWLGGTIYDITHTKSNGGIW